jgi:carboxylate-amine ligase
MIKSEPTFSLGIEEEYLLVDPETGELAIDPPAALFADAEARLGDRVSREFLKSQIEVGTGVCTSLQAARAELGELRGVVAEVAARYDLAPIAASTHPFSSWATQEPTDRARYQSIAKDLAGVGQRLVICGMHVHVGLGDDDLRIDLMNQVRYFLPHLLTLSTSSPFQEGTNTGLKCYRLAAYHEIPRTGLPGRFASWEEYRETVDVLVRAGVIEDASKIWWDVRPSCRFPTLEMRATDVATRIDDAVSIAALYVTILRMLWRQRRANLSWRTYPVFLIAENRWRAMRYGVGGTLFDFGKGELVAFAQLLDELLARIAEDADALGCTAEVLHAREIVRRGTSADHQVAVHDRVRAATGDEKRALKAVVDELILLTKTV